RTSSPGLWTLSNTRPIPTSCAVAGWFAVDGTLIEPSALCKRWRMLSRIGCENGLLRRRERRRLHDEMFHVFAEVHETAPGVMQKACPRHTDEGTGFSESCITGDRSLARRPGSR